MPEWKIERLNKTHERDSFGCGKTLLDEFLHKLVSQYERRDLGRTFVATLPPAPAVLGYFTLAAGSVAFATLPEAVAKKLPRHPVPVAHLGRLAVDRKAQGQRLGETMLLDALRRCYRSAEELGLFGVEVYALDDEAQRFYRKYGFTELADDPLHLYLPMKTIRKLFER